MSLTKTVIAAVAATTLASTAFAGGFAEEIVEAPVTIVEPAAPAGTLPGWVIPAVLVAGLVALAVSDDDTEDDNGG